MDEHLLVTKREVWETLSPINVNNHTQKTYTGLTYLSWTWAWQVMKEYYPEFEVEWFPTVWTECVHPKSGEKYMTAEVSCAVRIGPLVYETMWLPVMEGTKGPKGAQNEATINPTSREISDTKQRCLVKCFAVLGLGLYIYAGEDIPTAIVESPEQVLIRSIKALARDLYDSKHPGLDEKLRAEIKEIVEAEQPTLKKLKKLDDTLGELRGD